MCDPTVWTEIGRAAIGVILSIGVLLLMWKGLS